MRELRTIFLSAIVICCAVSVNAATFVVDNNADTDDLAVYTGGDGTNTLRKCIRLANTTPGADVINFNLPGSTLITMTSGGWFVITDPVTIDGYSQPGASAGNLLIEIDGNASGKWFMFSLEAGSDASVIRGLNIYGTLNGIRAAGSGGHTFSGNYIGTNLAGTAQATNPIIEKGIRLESSSNNTIGGTGGQIDRNIISGCNQRGVSIEGTSSNNTVVGNYIGTNAAGDAAITNGWQGVTADNCTNLAVGGNVANAGNLISGNTQSGIQLNNSTSATIQGNIIGLGIDGTTSIPNGTIGIELQNNSHDVQIGGTTASARNIVSSNTQIGIRLVDSDFAVIEGNNIGVDASGLVARGNGEAGINASNSEDVTVGGAVAGAGNVISANGSHGITINGTSPRAIIKGNFIGVAGDGLTAMANSGHGIELIGGANSVIGGSTVQERNIIANSPNIGLQMVSCDNSVVEGNYIGTNATGTADHGNSNQGINIDNSPSVRVGGTTYGQRNIIVGSGNNGIAVGGTSSGVIIKGNFIGVGADGSTFIGNGDNGIITSGTANNMIIGGPTFLERNVIADNGQVVISPPDPDAGIVGDGVRMLGTGGHLVQGNYFGTDSTGTIGAGNHWAGISLNASDGNTILDNLICDNRNEGIWIEDSDNNIIKRNQIGLALDGNPLGNWDWGIVFVNGSSNNTIGGGSVTDGNIITNTRGERPTNGPGIEVVGQFNEFTFNSIYCNKGQGINLNGAANESVAAPVISFSNANDLAGTGASGNTIHIYRNVTADGGSGWCDCEGEVYIGTTTVDGSGNWSYTHNLGLTAAQASSVSATQTTPSNSTSEFSACSAPLPVNYLFFEAEKITNSEVLLSWGTIEEIDNDYFIIQRSTDGVNFEDIGTVAGNGNSGVANYYNFTDYDPGTGMVYYRLKQVDYDGNYSLSMIRSVILGEGNVSINQTGTAVDIITSFEGDVKISISLVNLKGQVLMQDVYTTSGTTIKSLRLDDLPSGVYILQLQGGGQMVTEKLVF